MAETILDYDKTNKYLPTTLREFVGTADRVAHQDFGQFIPFYTGVELSAILNNKKAAEFAGGFTDLNYQLLRAGAAPRILKVLVTKSVGRVWYQAEEDNEEAFDKFLSVNLFRDKLKKAAKEAMMTGRSALVVYPKDNNKIEIASYNLFRHKLRFDKNGKVIEAFLYMVRIDNQGTYTNVICEHRYYGKTNGKPYQKFELWFFDDKKVKDATPKEIDYNHIPDGIKEQYKDVTFGVAKEIDYPSIGVYDIKETVDNSKFVDVDIPEALFVDALDTGVCLDSSVTGKEVDKEIGRGRILYPDFQQNVAVMDQTMVGDRCLRSIGVSYNDPIMTPYPSRSLEDNKPINVQFDTRSATWDATINEDVARLCANVGLSILDYDPRLLQTGQRTDDEINAMTDITAATVQDFRDNNEDKINDFLTDIATHYKLNVKVSIRWSMASILNPTKNTFLVKEQLGAGLISRKEAIRRVNPDLNSKEIDDLYNSIMAERGAEATENAFNNF